MSAVSCSNRASWAFRRTEDNLAAIGEVAEAIAALQDKSAVYSSGGDQTWFCDTFAKRGLVRPEDPLSNFAIDTNWPMARPDSFTIHYVGMMNLYRPW